MRKLLIALAIALLSSIAVAQDHGGGSGGMSGGGHMGGGMRGSHFAGHSHIVRHHRAFDPLLPLYGDAVPPYESDDDNGVNASPPETVAGAPEPTLSRGCSQQAVTVPSEAGGVRQVTIIRC